MRVVIDLKIIFREQKVSSYFEYNICYNFRITLSVFEMWQYKEDRIKRYYKAKDGLTEPFKIFMSRI